MAKIGYLRVSSVGQSLFAGADAIAAHRFHIPKDVC